MTDGFATTPRPPYYAVIFSSQRTGADQQGYETMAAAMVDLALKQPGCLGAESARDPAGFGITVSYFADEASIAAWKRNAEHLVAQRLGQERWYSHYTLRVARVERDYSGPEGR